MERVLKTTGIEARSTPAGRRVDVDGVHTNVSLSRFLRLFELLIIREGDDNNKNDDRASVVDESSVLLPLTLRFLWESSRSKQDLLDFLGVVDSYTPILRSPLDSWSKKESDAFLTSRLSPEKLRDTTTVERACMRLLGGEEQSHSEDMELVAASLSSAHAFKPAVKMSSIRGRPPSPIAQKSQEEDSISFFDNSSHI